MCRNTMKCFTEYQSLKVYLQNVVHGEESISNDFSREALQLTLGEVFKVSCDSVGNSLSGLEMI